MPPGNWLKLSSSSAWSMRAPILVEWEICSSVILRFSRSSFSFAPKDGKLVSRFRRTANGFYSVEKQDHRKLVLLESPLWQFEAAGMIRVPGCHINRLPNCPRRLGGNV